MNEESQIKSLLTDEDILKIQKYVMASCKYPRVMNLCRAIEREVIRKAGLAYSHNAPNPEIVSLIEAVRSWGIEHTGCEPSISRFHKSVDDLLMKMDGKPSLNEYLARFAPVADEADRRIADTHQNITDNFRGDDKALIESAVSLLALDAKGALSGGGIGGHARTIIESFVARSKAKPTSKQEPDKQGYFAYDYDNGFELFDSAEDAENAAQKYLDGYREWAHEGWDEGVEQICWGKVQGSIASENCGQVEFEGEMVEAVNYKLFSHPVLAQAAAIPDWLMEMSSQMRTQDNRGTSHPLFQVRCKEYLPTDPECSADRWEIVGDDGVVCAQGDEDGFIDYLLANHADWCKKWNEQNYDEESDRDALESWFDPTGGELPEPLRLIWTQEVEKIVSTHLTEAGALQFINRKQHDYPKLYTYAESAYWSPQLRQLQDWIISLSAPKPDSTGGESC